MAVSMYRSGTGLSNLDAPLNPASPQPYEYYEMLYTTAGPQEWITIPGPAAGPVSASVTISFPLGPGSADLQGTTSGPSAIVQDGGGVALVVPANGWNSPVVFDIVSAISDTVNINVCGPTAIRLNVSGAPVLISVRV